MPNYTCPSWSQGASCLLGMSACVFLTPIFLQITRLAVRETFLEGSAGPKGQGGTGLRRKEGALALPFSVLPSPEMQSLIVLQLQFTVGLTQDLAPCVLRPNPVSDTHSDLRSSFSCPSSNFPGCLASGTWMVASKSLCNRKQHLHPRGLCSQGTSVQRWEHRPISCVRDERLLWLESSPGPCGGWEARIMVTLGISRSKASEPTPLENSQGTRLGNSALPQQFLQPTVLLWASNFISPSLSSLICKTRVPISRGGWKDSVR